jgi:hypothetical protein
LITSPRGKRGEIYFMTQRYGVLVFGSHLNVSIKGKYKIIRPGLRRKEVDWHLDRQILS